MRKVQVEEEKMAKHVLSILMVVFLAAAFTFFLAGIFPVLPAPDPPKISFQFGIP